jgi:hypothetical protein
MTHVIQIQTGLRVVGLDTGKPQTDNQPKPVAEWAELVAAIDQRAHYVGPVLEDILRKDHDTRFWNQRA